MFNDCGINYIEFVALTVVVGYLLVKCMGIDDMNVFWGYVQVATVFCAGNYYVCVGYGPLLGNYH